MDRRSFIRKAGATGVGAAAAAATLAAPAIAQSNPKVTWRLASSFPKSLSETIFGGALTLSKYVSEVTDGNFQIQVFAAGEIVPALQVADAVTAGTIEAAHTVCYYFWGKDPTWALGSAVPFSLNARGINAWHYQGGGIDLFNEFLGTQGIIGFPSGNTGVQMGGWFNKEMNSPEDFRGLRMRIPGIGGDMMANMGVSVVSLPGGQIYENLVSGAIDATEWVGPWNDYFLNLHQAARYYYWPGVHEPGAALSMGFNKSWLTSLPTWQQKAIEYVCGNENDRMLAEYNANNGDYLQRLVNEHGVQLREFNDDIYDAFGVAADATFETIVSYDDMARRMHEAFLSAREKTGGWMNISDVAYLRQRNRVLGID